MEYIQSKPNNIDVYVNEFHTRIKTEFEKSINKIYNEELSVYRQVIETVVKLPFIQEIIEENKTLKAKLKNLEEADNIVKLEIFDKPVSKTLLDVETIPFSSESNSSADSDDDDADDESSGGEGDSSEDEDKPLVDKADTNTKPSADKAVKSLCKNQDCSPMRDTKFTEKCSICSGYFTDDGLNDIYFLNENGGVGSCDLCKKTQNVCIMKGTGQCICVNACDEEEEEESSDADDEQSADEDEDEDEEEDKSPTFPVKIIVNKLDKEEDNLEEVEEEEYTEEEIAYNKIDDVMFNKKCLNTDMKKNVKLVEEEEEEEEEEVETETEEVEEEEEEEEEPSADQEEEEEPSADQEDAEVIEIEIDGKTYYCESEENGNIYEDDNGEVGNIVGEIKDGEATFFE